MFPAPIELMIGVWQMCIRDRKIVRPLILVVLAILFVKILLGN